MKMVMLLSAAVILLASFDLGVCQRKISRNVAVGADVKTVVHFDCPEEFGYYPHPNDCTQYYVCVFGGALLESCTGGLMYSHELQTCDWPRNVGCDGAELSAPGPTSQSPPPARTREEPRSRYTPQTPPPPQPAAVVTSRGQPRQLHHNQQEIIKQRQQQQLYAEAEETLPPAEEIENDRQQRVYRGQPSTVGQVQRDRDGLRHSNAIPSYSGRGDKIGVISFGTQQQQQQQYSSTDDLLTNDLTLKRRRKRQIQRSRHPEPTSWRTGQPNNKFRLTSTPINLQPPPVSFPNYQSNFVPVHLNNEEFKPFVPQYKNFPQQSNKESFIQNNYFNNQNPSTPRPNDYQNNYSYFTIGEAHKPLATTQVKTKKFGEPDKIRHTVEFYNTQPNLMQPQSSHVVNQNLSSIQISKPNLKSTVRPIVKYTKPPSDYRDYSDKSEEFSLSNSDYFGPPPSYFNFKNKYEHISNPFASPDFDFDHFLDKIRGDRVVPKEKPVEAKTQPAFVSNTGSVKPVTNEYYYYDEEVTQVPKKIYSSQIKPNYTVKPVYDYYYEDYDYPETKNSNGEQKPPVQVVKNGDVKYSAKYQEKPKVSKTTKPSLTTTSYKYVISTTPATTTTKNLTLEKIVTFTTTTTRKPKYTTRQRVTSTRPTSRAKNRPKLTTNRTDKDKRLRVEPSTVAPVQAPISTATATARTLYNSSQYNGNNYDPYYALYDEDVELYRDVDYSQYNSQNQAQQSYRRTPAPAIQSTTAQEEQKRGNAAYIQNNYNSQDIYQPSTVPDYNEDNSYNAQVEDQTSYRQVNRQPPRGDRNDLNYIEEAATKRTTTTTRKPTTTTTRTTTTTPRTIPPKKSTVSSKLPVTAKENKTQVAQSLINTLLEDPGQFPISSTTPSQFSLRLDLKTTSTNTITSKQNDTNFQSINVAVINKPAPFTLPKHLTTEKPLVFHYITKSSKSTPVSTKLLPTSTESQRSQVEVKNRRIIVPTTYSPPKFFLKSLLPRPSTTPVSTTSQKTAKKFISPLNVNYGLSSVTGASFESAEKLVEDNPKPVTYRNSVMLDKLADNSSEVSTTTTTEKVIQTTKAKLRKTSQKLRHYVEPYSGESPPQRFRSTVEVPPPYQLLDNEDKPKQEPDQSPDYKLKPFPKPIQETTTKTDVLSQNSSIPARVSRVNTAIKSLIAFGGTRRQNVKCHENQSGNSKCNEPIQRTNTRGRGSASYSSSGNVANNEVTVNVNRGTPASRSRPTLKPSTSIVSKASEFIDIYKFPPTRPESIYPQPQPDKTAAKCRKDVCLLPDCSCGGKEIPGNLPVEEVPQLVLLTFDDAVNDLNKEYYIDLFENGRLNPNGCPITATFYVSHEWTDYSQVQNLYADGHEMASHTVSHSFGEQFSQKKWTREVAGQREILSAYGGVHLEDVRGMRAPFLSVGGNKMFKMLYDSNFTYDSSMPIYENKPPSWPYTLDYKLFHDCMIPPCPTRSYPGVWEVPMVMWQDLNGGRCSMGDACSNPPDSDGVFKMLTKNFQRHYTTNRAPFGLFYHAAWFTQPHHKEGFINFLDSILEMKDVWLVTNWQAIQWIRDPTPMSRLGSFQPFQCDFSDRPKRCNNPKVCNLWHKSGVRYMRTCQPCPDIYPWTGNSGIRSSRIDNDIED